MIGSELAEAATVMRLGAAGAQIMRLPPGAAAGLDLGAVLHMLAEKGESLQEAVGFAERAFVITVGDPSPSVDDAAEAFAHGVAERIAIDAMVARDIAEQDRLPAGHDIGEARR